MKRNVIRRLVDGADLLQEALPGQPVLEVLGRERVLIENHRGILEYNREKIRVQVEKGSICICGNGMCLRLMQQAQLVIVGKIESITLSGG